MIKSDGLDYIRRGFRDEGEAPPSGDVDIWALWPAREAFEALYEQLVDDHGLSPMSAVDILESAFEASVGSLFKPVSLGPLQMSH